MTNSEATVVEHFRGSDSAIAQLAELSFFDSGNTNDLEAAFFIAVAPNGDTMSGSVSVEVNDPQSGNDCSAAATGIGD